MAFFFFSLFLSGVPSDAVDVFDVSISCTM